MKRKKRNQKKINLNTFYFIAIFFLLSSYLFIFNENIGYVGNFIKDIFYFIFGVGTYVFPAIFSFFLATLIFPKKLVKYRKRAIYLILFFFSIMIFTENLDFQGLPFAQRLELQSTLWHGYPKYGLITVSTSFFLDQLVGGIGVNLISIFLIITFLLLFLGYNWKEFLSYTHSIFLKLIEKLNAFRNEKMKKRNSLKTAVDKKDSIAQKKEKKNHNVISDDQEKKPIINDYKNKTTQLSVEDYNIDLENARNSENYKIPPLELLQTPSNIKMDNQEEVLEKAKKIEQTLEDFGIQGKVVQINTGPTITSYEVQPAAGVKVSRIVNLADDLSLNLASSEIRIQAPIPGKSVVGIEVANEIKEEVLLKEILVSDDFSHFKSKLPLVLGKNINGSPVISAINKMPHLLIAGATGSGKSVCINTLLISLLYHASPHDVKLILIDPKVVELSVYNGIPHLAIPVVTNPKKASFALNWAVREMERRYLIFSENHVRDINSYNKKNSNKELEHLPYLVIVIDELSDLMMVAAGEVEDSICRLAQMARACGIHLIIATQRPTVDVITGTIKANISSRISFQVSSQIDSRTILDESGAEKLLGRGDMLFLPSGRNKPLRIQGAYVSDKEVENIVNYIKDQNETSYNEEIIEEIKKVQNDKIESESSDELYDEALSIVVSEQTASISFLQRKLKIGYARAGRLIDEMEENGIISGYEGSKPRKVLVGKDTINLEGVDADEHSQ